MPRHIDVLVVDDRTIDAEMTLIAVRKSAPRARVLRLRTGDVALQYLFGVGEFSDHPPGLPRLVLLSADLPTATGLCVLDVVRAHPYTASLPIVLLSSPRQGRIARRSDRFDADAYLTRPLSATRYVTAISAVLSRWLPEHTQPVARIA